MRLRAVLVVAACLLLRAPEARAVAPIFDDTPRGRALAARAIAAGLTRKPPGMDRTARAGPPPPTVGRHYKAIVILLQFPPDPGIPGDPGVLADTLAHPPSGYDSLLFSVGTHPTGSLRDYYHETSRNQFDISGVVTRWYTAPHHYAYYTDGNFGKNDPPNNAQQMARDATVLADADLDFRDFDNDGPDGIPDSGDDDGFVDALFVVHAGPGAEETGSPDDIASHQFEFENVYTSPDPGSIQAFLYTTEPEKWIGMAPHTAPNQIMSVGTFCHEFGHILALPDLYDTSAPPTSEGIGEWDLMGSGNFCHAPGESLGTSPTHFSAWSKVTLGWVAAEQPTDDQPGITLTPVETGGPIYRLWTDGDNITEYFLIENRQPVGFDAGLVRRSVEIEGLQAHGLVIYHVDESVSGNNYAPHKQVDVEEAGGAESVSGPQGVQNLDVRRGSAGSAVACGISVSLTGNRGDRYDPWPGPLLARDFSSTSCPSSVTACGGFSQVAVKNITETGQDVTADIFVKGATVLRMRPAMDDAPSMGTPNNGNGLAEQGESVRLRFPLANLGLSTTQSLYAKLSALDPYATITAGDSIDYGAIGVAAFDSGTVVEAAINAAPDPIGSSFRYELHSPSGVVMADTVQILIGTKTGICDDFEGTTQRWYGTPAACSSVNEWHRESGINSTPGGAWAWRVGPVGLIGSYANEEDARLVSQPIRLTGTADTLSFYHRYDTEPGRDGLSVEISADAGATWALLHPVPDYPFPGNLWSGLQTTFTQAKIPLTGFAGTVQIAFRFQSFPSLGGLGWWIDDVRVNGDATCLTTAVEVRRFDASVIAPGPAVRLEWDLEDGAYATVGIDRAVEAEGRGRIATLAGGTGAGSYEDRDVVPGRIYRYWLTAAREGEAGVEAGPVEVAIPATSAAPRALALGRPQPNPFNPSSTIPVSLDRDGPFVLRVLRADGSLVRTLHDGPGVAGTQRFRWDGTDDRGASVGSGVYFVILESDSRRRTEKVALLR
ncbi:MAG: M6 family metalloprotease domain-containing protein [Candidatus Latescibacteria bacterium]|nr:M6 family metalloprotease domain-containing protein [Candidatus Latescibacterota bacterium]